MFNELVVNVPVSDVAKSRAFFEALGFELFEPWSGPDGFCVKLSATSKVIVSSQAKFEGMVGKPAGERDKAEMVLALSCTSAEQVNALANGAFTQGGRKVNEPDDNEYMYSWAFEDLDGHLWDLFFLKN